MKKSNTFDSEQLVYRAYRIKHKANISKIEKLNQLHIFSKQFFDQNINDYYLNWIKTGHSKKKIPYKSLVSYKEMKSLGFFSRFIEHIGDECFGTMGSWISSLKIKITQLISDNLNDEEWHSEKEKLYYINYHNLRKPGTYVAEKEKTTLHISQDDINLYLNLVHLLVTKGIIISKTRKTRRTGFHSFDIIHKENLPKKNNTFVFNSKIGYLDFKSSPVKTKFRKNADTKISGYRTTQTGWLNIRDGVFNISLPLVENTYAQSEMTVLDGAGSFSFSRDSKNIIKGNLSLNGKKRITKKEISGCGPIIAIDFGLTYLFTVYKQDDPQKQALMFGKQFYKRAQILTDQIHFLEMELQKQGILRKTNKRYQKLIKKKHNFFKSEINRILNNIVKTFNPRKIIIENLSLSGLNHRTKRFNRILSSYSISLFYKKMDQIKEETSIEVIRINPAYTSQQCKNKECGFTHIKNRKTITQNNKQKNVIKCKCCGFTQNSDGSGAYGIYLRGSSKKYKSISLNSNTKIVKDLLWKNFINSYHGKLLYGKMKEASKSSDVGYHCMGFEHLSDWLTQSGFHKSKMLKQISHNGK